MLQIVSTSTLELLEVLVTKITEDPLTEGTDWAKVTTKVTEEVV